MNDSQSGENSVIGIIGGMGPQAGLDLASKIIAETLADQDQQHLPVVLFSMPKDLPDRTEFLLGRTPVNPGAEIARQLRLMETLGVTVAAIACNTAHADPIFEEIRRSRCEASSKIRLLHLVDETVRFIQQNGAGARRIGLLATEGTYRFQIYEGRLKAAGLEPILPNENDQADVQSAIFDSAWGIKAQSSPVSVEARQRVKQAVRRLLDRGADTVVLGCTELVLALDDQVQRPIENCMDMIDPAWVMARALVSYACPDRLRPLHDALRP